MLSTRIRTAAVTLVASACLAGVAVPATSLAARTTQLPPTTVHQVSKSVALEASALHVGQSKADDEACKKEAKSFNTHLETAQKEAKAGNIRGFTEEISLAASDRYGMTAVGCQVTPA